MYNFKRHIKKNCIQYDKNFKKCHLAICYGLFCWNIYIMKTPKTRRKHDHQGHKICWKNASYHSFVIMKSSFVARFLFIRKVKQTYDTNKIVTTNESPITAVLSKYVVDSSCWNSAVSFLCKKILVIFWSLSSVKKIREFG